jgi:acetyltransferase-like isoleucine patch superfamily enzyme
MIDEVSFGADVTVAPFTNLYGCTIGDRTRVGPFVEIQAGAVIGSDCKIQSHSFICDGVTIEDEVFVGHGVVFVNDKFPRATTDAGEIAAEGDWTMLRVVVRRGAAIGSGAVILADVEIGERATIGAGAVVVRDVPPETTVVGNPAR